MKSYTKLCRVLLFSSCSLLTTEALATAPAPNAVIAIGNAATVFIGSQACFSVDITNSGTDTGFGPYYRLILPPSLTLASVSFLGQSVSTDVLGLFPASPGNQILDTRANDSSVSGTAGHSLTNLVLPLGSLSQGAPSLTTNICLDISTSAAFAVPLSLSLQPILQFGDTAPGDNGAIAGTAATTQITPTVISYSSSNNAPAGKQVPGTTFALTYGHVIDVADTAVVTSVALDETFSSDLTFAQFNPAAPVGGSACAYGSAPGSNMTMSCTSITGVPSSTDVSTGYIAHINDILDESTCAVQTITHNSTLDGAYLTSALSQANSSNSVSVRHLTLVKSLSPGTLNPGGTITVAGTIRVSDFSTVSSLSFTDQLPDGLTFASHSDLTINGGSSVTITPVSVVNGDGTGTVSYALTAVSGNIAAGSAINYSYTVTVDAAYNDASPILASDSFSISGIATYDLTAGASNCSDSHSSSVGITAVSFSSEILNPQADYQPGDVVTFTLSMAVPSGDTQSINYSTYFPLPVFDVSSVNTTFGFDVKNSVTNTLVSTPDSITVDAATNALIIAWPDVSSASAEVLSVDVAITVTDEPFADNLYLSTLFSGQASNTPAVINADINPVQTLVRNASLIVTSGLSEINHSGTLSDVASDPVNSDASGVDAGDIMTQTITITNEGGATAYKINVSQPDLANLSAYTLTAATLNGGDISADLTGSLSTTLVLNSGTSLPAGQSMVLTYTYQIAQGAKVAETLQPQSSVTWSASVSSVTEFTAKTDSLDITLADISVTASVASVTPEGHTGNFVTGDIVTYQGDVYIPEGTVTDLVVDFVLPPGLEYVAASSIFPAGFTGTQVAATEVTTGVVATGQTRKFTFTGDTIATNNNNAADNIIVITFDALVKDDVANAATGAEQSKTLIISATYQGDAGSHTDNDSQAFTEHQLAITTTVSPANELQAGDSAIITFVVTNNGTAPAYDVALSNAVDSDLFDLSTAATGSGGCGYANPNFTCSWASIAVGASETVSYTAAVQDDVQTGATFTINGAVTGDSQSGVVTSERDQSSNAGGNTATQALSVESLTVISSSENFTSSATTEPLAIGETVTYELVVTIPEGISQQTTDDDFISFTLPAGLQYIANSALIRWVYDTPMTSDTLGVLQSFNTALEPGITGQTLSFDLGNVDNGDGDVGDEQVIVTITALVLNTSTNTSGHDLVSTGRVNYLNQAAAAQSDNTYHAAEVWLPNLALTHTVSPSSVEGGNTVTYTLTATNTAAASATNGYDWAIFGTVPAILNTPALVSAVLSRGSLDISACAGFTGNALSIDGSCLAGGNQGASHYLAPGESISVVYTATVDASVGFEQTIANTMDVSITSLSGSNGSAAPGTAGSDTGERIGDNSSNDSAQAVNDMVIMANANLTSNAPTLTLSASTAQSTILDSLTLTASFAIPVGSTDNFVYTLDLPTGLSYQNDAIVITLPGSDFITTLSPNTTPGAGTDPISLDFGTMSNSAATVQSATIVVNVVVDNILANQNSTTLTANSGLSYTGVSSAPADTAVVTVIEPNLTINQLITAGNVGSDAGDTISYQVTVANTAASATAYRVNLSDLLPPELLGSPDGDGAGPTLTNISVTNPADAIVLSDTATPLDSTHYSIGTTTNANDTLSFTAFDLPAGVTLTYSYDAVVANSAAVGATVVNDSSADYDSLAPGGGRSGSAANDDDDDVALDNYNESDSSNLTLDSSIAVQHNLTTGQPDANFAIGETVSMDVRIDISEGTTNTLALTQVLDSGLTFVSASVVAAGHISYNGAGTASESPIGTIAVLLGDISNVADSDNSNDFLTWRVVARVNDNGANVASTVLNANASATSSVGNAGPQTLAITVVEPNLLVTITPSSATTSLGDEVTFTVVVAHSASGADAFDSELNLVMPSGLTYVPSSFSGQGNLNDANTSLLNVDLSSIALSDSSKTFSFRATVDNTATANSTLAVSLATGSSYSATSGTTTDDRGYSLSGSGATTVSAPSFIDAAQSVTIINDNGNGVADAGEILQYNIVITNNGTTASNVNYTEIIPTGTSLVNASLTSSSGTVTETSGTVLLASVGSMNNGDVVTVTYQVVIDAGIAAGSEIIAQGSVDSDQTISELSDSDGNEANGDQAQVTSIGGQPMVLDALYVQQLANWTTDADADSNVSPGDTITMYYFIENRGDSQLTAVSVSDSIVSGLSYVAASATTDSGTIDVTTSNITLDLNTLNAGEQVVASVTLTIDNPLFNSDGDATAETFVMQAIINSNETSAALADQNGIIADGNQATSLSAVTGGGGSAAPVMVKQWGLSYDADSDGLVDAGDEVTYWLTVINNGSVTATNAALDEVIPTNTTIVTGSVNSSQGVVITDVPISVNLLDIAPGQLVSVSYTVTVDGATADGTVISAQGSLSGGNFATVQSDDNGLSSDGINPTLFTVNNSTTSTLGSALQLSASSDPATTVNNYIQGETLTLQASFTLPAGTTDDLVLTVNIPTGLLYQSGSATLKHNFDTGLSATRNPASINTTASGVAVNVDNLLTNTNNSVSLVLGTVVNSDNDVDSELYQLNLSLNSTVGIPTASSTDLLATAVASFLDSLNQSKTSQSPNLTLTLLNRLPLATDDSDSTNEDIALNLTLIDNDSDSDNGQTLTISATTVPANGGSVTIAGDGNSVDFTPAANYVGSDSFDYTLLDSAGGTNTATVTLTVNAVQDAPMAVNDAVTLNEDSTDNTITILTNDNDVDGDTLTVTAATSTNGTVTINSDGSLNYSPNGNFNGTDTITYTISDNNGGTDTATVTVTVIAINDAPVAANDTATVTEDSSNNSITVLANDSDMDGDTLTVTAASSTNGTVMINGDGTLNYAPNADFNGTDTITYTISDNNGGTDTATVTVTVTAINDTPVAVNDTATVTEDSSNNSIMVLANDSDVDGDTLTVTAATSTNGTVTINGDGSLNYSANADFNGSDMITYSISDGNGGRATATVTITVSSVNDAPVAINDTATVSEDSSSNTLTVLTNDSDLDGDSLTVTAASSSNGTVTINGDGTLNYVPNGDFNGTDTITYTVSDGNGGMATATMIVTVGEVNDAPVAVNDTAAATEDSNSNPITVLSNDSDLDGDSLTVSAASSSNGTVTINGDGTLNYVPNDNFNGTDTISYTISDGNGGTATATVTVTVDGVNDAPVAVNDTATVSEDSSSNIINVLANDTDIDGDSLTVSAATSSNGTVTINADGTLNYVPNGNFNGTDILIYSVSDGNGGSTTATVTVTVSAVNDAPVAVNDSVSVSEDSASNTVNALGNDTDVDGDTLTVDTATSSNGAVTINADGTLSYVPNGNFNGTDTINYTISDGNGGTATATITVTVGGNNDSPVALNDRVLVSEDSNANTIEVLTNDSDLDGDTLTVDTATSSNGTVTINADGSLNYIPNADFNGTDTITYTISDGNGGTATATVNVTIDAVNDTPIAVDDTAMVSEDSNNNTINVLNNDTDIDGDSLSVDAASASNGTVTINADGSLNYTPTANFSGTDTITYTVSDGNGGTTTAMVTVDVGGKNDAPVAVNDTATVNEDSDDNVIDVLANDTDDDGDPLTITLATASNGKVTINADGTLSYIPTTDFSGTDIITYTLSDGNGGSTTATVIVTVIGTNDSPVMMNDSTTVSQNSSSNSINVLANDSDPDGDSLTVTTATATNGTVTINADGTLGYVPNDGFSGADTITYTVSDGNGGTGTATVAVTVNQNNGVPVAVNDSATVNQDSGSNSINVLANDSDPDGDSLTVTTATATNGTVTINADGTLGYIPNDGFSGADTITYIVSDGNGGMGTGTVTVIVNAPPIAVDDSITISEDTSGITFDVLSNDSDPDGDSLSGMSATSDNGTVTINPDGTLNFIPDPDFSGTAVITYSVSDGNGGIATATVTVEVTAQQDAPVAKDDFIVVEQGVVIEVNVLGNDVDADGDMLTVTAANSAFGTVVINADNSITFTPSDGFVGEAVINYSISDGNGGVDSAQVHIVIDALPAPVNNPPIAVDDSVTVLNYDPIVISVLDNDSDPDGDTISLQYATTEYGTLAIVSNTLNFTPINGFTGEVVIRYSISDELGATATATVEIFIDIQGPVITLPADLCGDFTVEANALYTRVNLGAASAVDRFGNPLPVSLVNGEPLYPPGLNEAYWQATDAEGNSTVKAQKVCVNPLISINRDQTVPEGEAVKVGIFLNGEAPIYPLVVQYSVSGSANGDDHNLVNGEMTFSSGTEVYIDFTTTVDSLIEINEDIVIDLIGSINMGNKHQHITTISEGNIAPKVSLKVLQAQQERLVVSQQDGLVTVRADIYDANIGDSFSLEWTNPDGMLVNISQQSDNFVFVPSTLNVGLYQITIMVVDSGEPQLSDSASVYIEVVAQLAELSAELDSDGDLIPDNIEGYKDSDGDGVADYLDRIDECNVLSQTVEVQDGYLIEGEPGICLRRGYFTVGGKSGGAEITLGDINSDTGDELVEDVSALNVGGIFDYIAYGMPEEGSEYTIVMPQVKPIPQNAVYRKLFPSTGWGNFVENDTNNLWSTLGEPGYCPPPNSDKQDPNNVWTLGLTQNDWCVQMIIEDGGVNDDDGEINGNIVDPGGVSILRDNNNLPVAVDDYRTMALNEELLIDALLNDTDEDNDALTITSAIANFGSVEIVDNKLLYQSVAGYGGTVTIDYGIADESGASDHGIVTIEFTTNNAPLAQNDSANTTDNDAISINVLGNDSDTDGDILTIVSATVDNGSVTINQDNTLTYTPDSGFTGIATISYTVDDGQGKQATAQVAVSVEAYQRVIVNNKSKGGSMGLMIVALTGLLFYRHRRQRIVSKKRLVQGATGFAIAVSMNLAASETQWFVTGSIGQSQAKASYTLPANTQLISRTWDDRDTSYSIGGGFRYVDFSFILSYEQLGEATASYTGDVLDVEQFHQALADKAPKLAEGFSLKSEYTFWQSETLSASIGLGLIAWDSDYSSVLGDSVITKDQSDTNLFYTAALAYQLTEKTQLSVQATRYKLLMNDVDNIALALRYHF